MEVFFELSIVGMIFRRILICINIHPLKSVCPSIVKYNSKWFKQKTPTVKTKSWSFLKNQKQYHTFSLEGCK